MTAAMSGLSVTIECKRAGDDMRVLINFALFQIAWFASVVGAANQMPWLGPVAVAAAIAVHLVNARRIADEVALILSCGAIGAVFDSLLVTSGWVTYASGMLAPGLAPYWIIGMWLSFATTINVSLGWFKNKPMIAAAFGFVGGPLAYFTGAKLGAMQFIEETPALLFLKLLL